MSASQRHGMVFNRRKAIGLAGLGILAARPVGAAALSRAGADFSWLDDRLRQRVAAGYFDGIGLIIGRGPDIWHEAYFGNATPATVCHVASVGKWPAAATIASVVDRGLLRWDDPVKKFLPEFDDVKGSATLGQLLSHTSGFPDYQPPGVRPDNYQSLHEAVAHIQNLAAVNPPGQVFHYGGLAMQVAGRMAEIVTGMSFNAIFRSHLATPLGMDASGFYPVSQVPGFNPMLAGGFFTTTRDFGKYLAMIARDGRAQGQRLLSVQAITSMQADWVGNATVKADEYVELARGQYRRDIYGLGEWREEVDEKGDPTLISSPGWDGGYGWLDKRDDVWGFVNARGNVDVAKAAGYNTFLGSSIYAPMVRSALADAKDLVTRRAVIAVPGAKLYCETSGQGVPVVLLHGHSLDRRMWRGQIAMLEKHHRVIRYDLRGYGRSSMPVEGQDFSHAQDLRALLDALGIDKAHIVGLSLGGFIAADFLALYPQRVLKAVMSGGDYFDVPGPDTPWTAQPIAKRRQEIADLRKGGIDVFKRRWFEGLIAVGGSHADAMRKPLWEMIDEWQAWQPLHVEPRALLGRMMPALMRSRAISNPVLVVRGDREKYQSMMAALLPQTQTHIIADCGHLSNMERPMEFNAILGAFLDG